jgi:hypothetical protein
MAESAMPRVAPIAPVARWPSVAPAAASAPLSPGFPARPEGKAFAPAPQVPISRALGPADFAAIGKEIAPKQNDTPILATPRLAALARRAMPEHVLERERNSDAVAPLRSSEGPPYASSVGEWRIEAAGSAPAPASRVPAPEPIRAASEPTALRDRASPANPVPVPSPAHSRSPESGNIYLDGHQVGYWMVERLAREAGRPPSGATGFDPKLGAIWPGAPILP